MNVRLGEKIRTLRKAKNISQEVLAQYLGVSFQAVSKWENGDSMPDILLVPAIASFFEVSIDELFDFNRLETEQKIQRACWDIAEYRSEEPERAELALKELLKQYPGNDIILSNLTYVLQRLEKHEELINLRKTLIISTKHDDIRFDTARVLAETYRNVGEYAMCKEAIEQIPEFFFTHLEEKALLLEGEDMLPPAWQQKEHSLDSFIWMSMRLADYYESNGDTKKAVHQLQQAKTVILQLQDDDIPPFWEENYYMSNGITWIKRINKRLENITNNFQEKVHNTFDSYRRFY
jgi:transcriptional regulator with XRE-family HTH domain